MKTAAAVTVSALVHLMTAGLAVGGALLIVLGWGTVVQPALGFLLICLAAHLRPRRARLDDERFLRRADAPRFFALLDEIAESVGTRGVDAVRLTPEFAIDAVPFGPRGRRIDVGLALWETLTPQQRVACLAHQLGHFTAGDVRHHLLVRTVLRRLHRVTESSRDARTQREQAMAASPVSRHADEMAQADARFRRDSTLARWAVWFVTWPQERLARWVQRLAASTADDVEFHSDALAARVASTEAAVHALECLGLSGAVTAELRRLAVEARTFGRRSAAEELWPKLAAYAADACRTDFSRDVARVRIGVLSEAARCPARVTLDSAAAQLVDRELEPAKRALAERIVRDHTGMAR
jgi:Zn-dependent protease with chaperone function